MVLSIKLLLFFISILVLAMGKSCSHARQVMGVSVVATKKLEFKLAEDSSNFAVRKLQELYTTSADEVDEKKSNINYMKFSVSESKALLSSAELNSSVRKRENNWKDNFMAFAADYRSPKQHPPKNN